MVVPADVMALILAASPSFAARWDRLEHTDEGGRLLYLEAADLGRHLAGQLDLDDTAEFRSVFDLVERFHTEGDHWVREWATVGVLEALWPDDRFVPWLGPVSLEWWDRLRRFWSGDPTALQDGHGSS